jgi:hypothetical protein
VSSVDLAQLVDELANLPEDVTVYVNRGTGEILSIVDAEFSDLDGYDDDRLSEPSCEMAFPPTNSTDWVAMPDRSEIHEWQIMTQFARAVGGAIGDELTRAMNHPRWFPVFTDFVYRLGIEGRWLEFRRATVERLAIRALEAANVPYHVHPRSKARA